MNFAPSDASLRLSRRQVMAGAVAVASPLLVLGCGATHANGAVQAISRSPLRVQAARKGLSFGLSVSDLDIVPQSAAAQIVPSEADMIAPIVALKWGMVERRKGYANFAAADRFVEFGSAHHLTVRGHTAFWHRNLPKWAANEFVANANPQPICDHIAAIVGRYRGQIAEWDVVNEAVEPRHNQAGGLRREPFGRAIGMDWIAQSYAAAHSADPTARLYYNDYGLEADTTEADQRRAAVLGLLTELKRRSVPVHGVGLQTHLVVGQPFNAKKYATFLGDIAALGLEMRLTEFDVADRYLYLSTDARDAAASEYASEVLGVALDQPAMRGIICWGVFNQDSWLQHESWTRHLAGGAIRPLPFDLVEGRTALWATIANAFHHAPDRRPAGG